MEDRTSLQAALRAPRETTPERILASALSLFNRLGVDRVAVYKIAAEIGISPGNLTYHFTRKQDIIRHLIADLEHEAAVILVSPRDALADTMARYIVRRFQLMWRYHFFFQSHTYLAATDGQIAESYQRIMTMAQDRSIQWLEAAIANRDILPIVPPNSLKLLAENMWAVWVNRLGIGRPCSEEPGSDVEAVYDCVLHHLSLIHPYAGPRYIMRLHKEIRALLEIPE